MFWSKEGSEFRVQAACLGKVATAQRGPRCSSAKGLQTSVCAGTARFLWVRRQAQQQTEGTEGIQRGRCANRVKPVPRQAPRKHVKQSLAALQVGSKLLYLHRLDTCPYYNAANEHDRSMLRCLAPDFCAL